MEKLSFSIFINAPVATVWEVTLGKESFSDWTSGFSPTSRFEGDWSEGSKMRFIGDDPETGTPCGMVAYIEENRKHEYVSIKHVGIVDNGEEDFTSEKVKKWAPAYENYTFEEKAGGTQLTVEMDVDETEKASFDEMWSKSLDILKSIAEKR